MTANPLFFFQEEEQKFKLLSAITSKTVLFRSFIMALGWYVPKKIHILLVPFFSKSDKKNMLFLKVNHREISHHSFWPNKFEVVARLRRKAWCLDTRGFILKKIQWHIHAGLWSLVNCWREALMRHYIRCS